MAGSRTSHSHWSADAQAGWRSYDPPSGVWRFFKTAKLDSCAANPPQLLLSLLSSDRYSQIWCSHIGCIDGPTGNFSIVINAFGGFEANRKATFEIV
jgi:hypothetical protein